MRGLYSCLALGLAGQAFRVASLESEYDYDDDNLYDYDEDSTYNGFDLEDYKKADDYFDAEYGQITSDDIVYTDFDDNNDLNGNDIYVDDNDDDYDDILDVTDAPYIPPVYDPETEAPYVPETEAPLVDEWTTETEVVPEPVPATEPPFIQPDYVATEEPEVVPPVVLPERPNVVPDTKHTGSSSSAVWYIPDDLISRYYGSRPSKRSFDQLLELNCNSFISTIYKIHSDMSIDARSGIQVANNVRQVKDAFNGFMLKIYKRFDCSDMIVLELFEEFYGEIDFLINPQGMNPEGGYFKYEDFDFSRVRMTQNLFCDLLERMDYNVKYEFENAWRDLIYELEDCALCQQH